MAFPIIPPNSSGLVVHEVDDPYGVAITDATVVADVFSPASTLISGNILLVHSGDGVYTMEVDPTWSVDAEGLPVEGAYFALITADTPGGLRETVKYVWHCKFV